MFIQIHMLQSLPPGNVNRDDTGQPKKCIFGGVTRARISSQCLKRNIRHADAFKETFGDELATRTQYLPRMVADELRRNSGGIPSEDLDAVMVALSKRFKKEESSSDDEDDAEKDQSSGSSDKNLGKTPQLVFFPPPFARRIAELLEEFKGRNDRAYHYFIGRKLSPKPSKDEVKALKSEVDRFARDAALASEALTVDVAMFGRMTTSDLVVNVEAACQVAHAIGTHEALIESDYFTAMDDRKEAFVTTQSERASAAYLGRGESETFFSSSVFYKYFNLNLDALRAHLPGLSSEYAAAAAGTFLKAAALANPSGKQNGFACHSVPERILVEVSEKRCPISYANAFLQPVEGGLGSNLLLESSRALYAYVDAVVPAYSSADVQRALLTVGAEPTKLNTAHTPVQSLDNLVEWLVNAVIPAVGAGSAP